MREVGAARPSVLDLKRDPDPRPEHGALLVALDRYPDLDRGACLRLIEEIAQPLRARAVTWEGSADAQARGVVDHLCDRHGFHGAVEDYYDPRNSYLNDVLERRVGIPITLSILAIAVARRAGVVADPVGFPGHFLVQIGGRPGVYVDAFFARVLTRQRDLDILAERFLGAANRLRPEHLAPVGTLSIVVRVLLNLKHAYERIADHPNALVVCDRLVDLAGVPEHRRDRGLHALALGAREAAVEDLEAYLAARPNAPDEASIRSTLGSGTRTPISSN